MCADYVIPLSTYNMNSIRCALPRLPILLYHTPAMATPTAGWLALKSAVSLACGPRLARMVQRPVTAHVTNNMLDYSGRCQHTVAGFPELAGTPFRNLKYLFPDCTVMGVMNVAGGRCEWMPHNHTVRLVASLAAHSSTPRLFPRLWGVRRR